MLVRRGAALKRILQATMSSNDEPVVDLAGMRKQYVQRPDYQVDLTKNLKKDPLKQFDSWFQYVSTNFNLSFEEINAFALSTASKEGRPSSRMVLVKGYGPDGFRFYTNYNSRKGKELAENPYACLMSYWAPVNLSIRVEGSVEKLPQQDADEYWPKRPAKSRASAYVSQQSSVIASREGLEERLRQVEEQFIDHGLDIPRPKEWGGYVLKPDNFEFWQGDNDRLHDRVRFRKLAPGEKVDDVLVHAGEGDWVYERLSP